MKIEPVRLVGEGVVLRAATDADAPAALTMLMDDDIARWMPADVHDLESARGWCRRSADWSGHASFLVTDPLEDALLGNITLHRIDPEQGTGEVGYRVIPTARCQGVATAALETLTGWAFASLCLARIELAHAVPNLASCRVAMTAGYRLEGELRSAYVAGDGCRYDTHLHARLGTDTHEPAYPAGS